jgi:uncharacterized membrane protein SpoIIM required for sporulation
MSLERFIQDRRPAWNRLAGLVERLYARGPRRIPGTEINELLCLYRDVSADLARLRALEGDPNLVREINRVVTRAHAQIYRAPARRFGSLRTFLLVDYPCLFRRTWRFSLASFAISAAFASMAYYTVQRHPDVVADILGGADTEFRGEKTENDIHDRFRHTAAPVLSSAVTTNNIVVALNAFALGITFGVGTVYVLIVNGTMVGGFAGAYARSGAGGYFWMTILTHGALELSAIVIAGGAGLMMGYALWCPGERTRRRALREDAAQAVRLVLGLIPAFVVAGVLEGFVTPREDWPAGTKVALGVSVALVYWFYLLVAGRTTAPPSGSGSARGAGAASATSSD